MIDEFNEHHQEYEQPIETKEAPLLKRLDMEGEVYKQRVANFNRYCEAVNRHGLGKPNSQKAERVRIETDTLTNGDSNFSEFCASHVFDWYSDRNPYHLDIVFSACIERGIEPPPTVIAVMGEVAEARLNGELSGTPAKLLKNNIKGQVYRVMLNLIHAGANLEEAASKAAQWHNTTFTGVKSRTASSLDKDYSKHFRKPGKLGQSLEQEYFENWDQWKTQEAIDYWKKARATMPEADEKTKGVRRR